MNALNQNTAEIALGTAFEGGYFAGHIVVDGKTYALIVAPKAEGEAPNRLEWNTYWREATPGTQSVNDGFANSEAMNNADHPAAHWCRSLAIGGFTDWYLPSRDELELLYRNLKPTDDENYVYASRLKWWNVEPGKWNGVDENGNGRNVSSLPPGDAYTETAPAQTTIEAFRQGGAEAFAPSCYWSSTEFGSAYAWFQLFNDGSQVDAGEDNDLRVRAVRKVLI